MSGEPWQSSAHQRICAKLQPAFAALLEAYECAEDSASDLWAFAVPVQSLRELGVNDSLLEWLICKGYVEHAREVTVEGDDIRAFRPTGSFRACPRTCLVLTALGVSKARAELATPPPENLPRAMEAPEKLNGQHTRPVSQVLPDWDAEARVLRLGGQVVKRFKWQALNQEFILCAFQEEGWPETIDDPLPPLPDQDPKRRLQDTIKALNRNQHVPLIRFHGNGRGDGVLWEATSASGERH